MNFFTGFGKGFVSFFKGIGFVFEKGLWYYIFFPLILWLILLITGIFLTGELGDLIQSWIDEWIRTIPKEGHWLSWLREYEDGWLGIIAAWVIRIILWFVSGTFMKYVTLILLSPVFSLLSEAVAVKLGGKSTPFDAGQLFRDILRGTLISLRNMLFEYILMFVCFMLTLFFPPLCVITVPFLVVIGWYFVGFTMLDYSCERHRMGVLESIRFIRRNKGIACGLGFCYNMLMYLPLVGMMFAPIMAVSGATLIVEELKKNEVNVSKTI